MLTEFQIIFMQEVLHNFTIRLHFNSKLNSKTRGNKLPPIGSCWLDVSPNGNNVYHIYMDSKLTDGARDIVKLHELGHVWYRHHLINTAYELEVIRKLVLKITHANSVDRDICRTILNICMDLQINSEWMTFSDIDYMKLIGYPMVTAGYYDVDAGLDFREYYEPVIKKTIKVAVSSWTIDGNADVGGARFISDPDLVKPDTDVFVDKGSMNSKGGAGAGTENSTSSLQIYDKSDKSLMSILKSILDISVKMTSLPDSIKLYNRQCRGSSNLLYTSIKRKRNKVQDKLIIRFYVDISGSMNKSLLSRIFKCLSEFSKFIHKDSTLVTWNTDLVKEYPLNESILDKLTAGGGTELSGIIWHASNLGNHKYVVISDFDTPCSTWCESLPNNFYGIMYGPAGELNRFEEMLISRGDPSHMFLIEK